MLDAVGSSCIRSASSWALSAFHAVPVFVAVACLLTLPEFYQRRQPDFRDMANYLAARVQPRDVILFSVRSDAPWTAQILELAITHYARGAPCPMAVLSRPPDEMMLKDLAHRGGTF